jgi:LysM repeat protein
VADTGRGGPDTVVTTSAPSRRIAPEPSSRVVHRVKRGETLFSIAQKYNTSVAAVRDRNKLRGNTIKVGQRLTIAVSGATQAD